jgi:hypothetical protein
MSVQTTIIWRPYPEQKPPRSIPYLVIQAGKVTRLRFRRGARQFWWSRPAEGPVPNQYGVTHFALPQDISTQESP